jgi:hypothetical protein
MSSGKTGNNTRAVGFTHPPFGAVSIDGHVILFRLSAAINRACWSRAAGYLRATRSPGSSRPPIGTRRAGAPFCIGDPAGCPTHHRTSLVPEIPA